MEIGLTHYLTVAAVLFTLGVVGIFLNRKNVIIILMAIELMLLAVNINLVAFSTFLNDMVGQVFAMLVLTVAAAEAAIGLAILVVYFRNRGQHRRRGRQRDEGLGAGALLRRAHFSAPLRGGDRRPVRPGAWCARLAARELRRDGRRRGDGDRGLHRGRAPGRDRDHRPLRLVRFRRSRRRLAAKIRRVDRGDGLRRLRGLVPDPRLFHRLHGA